MVATNDVISYDINVPYTEVEEDTRPNTKYTRYLPTWDKIRFDPLPPFQYHDPALRVRDKSLPNLLTRNAEVSDIQPMLGSIVKGVQLTDLSDRGKDELAYLISQRKVIVLPDQDLIDAGPAKQSEFMSHFGKPNYQPVSGTVPGHPGFHIIHRNGNKDEIAKFLEQKTTTSLWHQDVSYEIQPPGYVMLGLLQGPEVGGDTVFAAADVAYRRLSPAFRSLLDGLKAVHSSAKMINHARATGSWVRKDPVDTVHPLIRVHPVTGEKCLYLNGEFLTKIIGLKDPESKVLLDFLLQHIVSGHDFQARVSWTPKTVVMFDNRSTIHSALVDYIDGEKGAQPRHIFRLCALSEKPVPVNTANKCEAFCH